MIDEHEQTLPSMRWTAKWAIAWAVGFALLHAGWALGNRLLLLDAAAADEAFGQPWFRVYNASVVVASLAAAGVVVVACRAHHGNPRRWAQRLLWFTATLLTLRGGIGVVQLVLALAMLEGGPQVHAWSVDVLMLLGGLLFGAVPRGTNSSSRTRARPACG